MRVNLKGIRDIMVYKKIMITAAKGGTGKSTFSVNLALGLQRKGYKVALVDFDVECPNINIICKIPDNIKMTIVDDVIIPYDWNGIKVISMSFSFPRNAAVLWDSKQKKVIIEQIIRLTDWGDIDFMIIDTSAGTGAEKNTILKMDIVGAIIVSNPNGAAISDGLRAKRMLYEFQKPLIGIINNMSYIECMCPNCSFKYDIKLGQGTPWDKDEILGEFPLNSDIYNSNILPNFDPIVDEILKRLPKLKTPKFYQSKRLKLEHIASKYMMNKLMR